MARDFARYFWPLTAPAFSGAGYEVVDVDRRAPGFEEGILDGINSYYADESLAIRGGVAELGTTAGVVHRAGKATARRARAGARRARFCGRGKLLAGLVLLLGASVLAMRCRLRSRSTALATRSRSPARWWAGAIGAWLSELGEGSGACAPHRSPPDRGCRQPSRHRRAVWGPDRHRRAPSDEKLGAVAPRCRSSSLPQRGRSIEIVVRKAIETMRSRGIEGEVVVADNGSTDGSPELAAGRRGAGRSTSRARATAPPTCAGFAAARGDYILMGDADDTYDFTEIPRFLEPLREGADMVIGNRMADIQPGAMPWLHRYVGNPVLTGLLNLFFRTGVSDAHCGMRAFRRDLLPRLDLRTTGMEFASEHVIRALEARPRHPRDRDRLPPAQGRVEALVVLRRLAAPALPAHPQPDLALPRSRRRARDRGAARRGLIVLTGIDALRPRMAAARADRLGAGADRRRADPPDRRLRARLSPPTTWASTTRCSIAGASRLRLEHGLIAGRRRSCSPAS